MFDLMHRLFSRRKIRLCHPGIICEQLEDRIVLDAAGGVTADHKTDTKTPDQDNHQPASHESGQVQPNSPQAATAPTIPDSLPKVFAGDLNVILVSNALDKIQDVSDHSTPNTRVISVDSQHDSLQSVVDTLGALVQSTGQKIGDLAILSHGNSALLTIGHDEITPFNFNLFQAELGKLSTYLSSDAQIQLYGCSIASNSLGQSLADRIAHVTSADVFASSNVTGSIKGDWTLEYASDPSKTISTLFVAGSLNINSDLASPYPAYENNWGKAMSGAMYFTADDGVHGAELWRSDGTGAGTWMVKDINAGAGSSNPAELTVYNGVLYFSADDGSSHGTQLWRSDGTAAGTYLVANINTQPNKGSDPTNFTVFNGSLYFAATDGNNAASHGVELWKTDGTAAGTQIVADIYPANHDSNPANLIVFNGNLYFTATDGNNAASHGVELWKTDGTAAGTQMVADINPGKSDSSPANLTVSNNVLFFSATDGNSARYHGIELWKTDGTAAGTVMVADINPGKSDSSPANLMDLNGVLIFTANDNGVAANSGAVMNHGTELWRTDGTPAGTFLVKDINPGTSDGNASGFLAIGGAAYFSADNGAQGAELWRTDGTPAGTYLVKDIYPGAQSSGPQFLNNYNGTLLFAADDGTHGYELWRSDGTAPGTYLFKDINPTGSSYPLDFARLNPLFFLADDGSGFHLWKTDGTVQGTVKVSDIGSIGIVQGPVDSNGSTGADSQTPASDSGAGGKISASSQNGLMIGNEFGSGVDQKAITSDSLSGKQDDLGHKLRLNEKSLPLFTTADSPDLSADHGHAKSKLFGKDVGKPSGDLTKKFDSELINKNNDSGQTPAIDSGESHAKLDTGIPTAIKVVILDDGNYSIRADAISFIISKDIWLAPIVKWYLAAVSEGRYRPGALPRDYERMIWDFLSNSVNHGADDKKPPSELGLKLAWQWAEWRRQISPERGGADVLPWTYFKGLSEAMILFYTQKTGKVDYAEALNALHQNIRNLTIIPVKLPEELMPKSPTGASK